MGVGEDRCYPPLKPAPPLPGEMTCGEERRPPKRWQVGSADEDAGQEGPLGCSQLGKDWLRVSRWMHRLYCSVWFSACLGLERRREGRWDDRAGRRG